MALDCQYLEIDGVEFDTYWQNGGYKKISDIIFAECHIFIVSNLCPCSYIPRDKIIHKLWIIFTAFARVLFSPRPHKENPGYEVGNCLGTRARSVSVST
jgi:hypothetical protein